MAKRNFMDVLRARWAEGKFVCVGLDSDEKRLPRGFLPTTSPQMWFNFEIVKATCDLVCAYKPNLAFYRGDLGKIRLQDTIRYINEHAPGVPVILDAKQGDIGATNDGYVAEDFDWYGADAVTVHNYLGVEAMRPFLDQKNKGIIVLCRTSNPGAGQLQDVLVKPVQHMQTGHLFASAKEAERAGYEGTVLAKTDLEMPLYQFVAHVVDQQWNYNQNCLLVVGATYAEEAEALRGITQLPFLVPGFGTQGADPRKAVRAVRDRNGSGFIGNSSSGTIFAYEKDPSFGPKSFAQAARAATQRFHDELTAALAVA
jgi:orotidine-5'-phosphate decarboxylase